MHAPVMQLRVSVAQAHMPFARSRGSFAQLRRSFVQVRKRRRRSRGPRAQLSRPFVQAHERLVRSRGSIAQLQRSFAQMRKRQMRSRGSLAQLRGSLLHRSRDLPPRQCRAGKAARRIFFRARAGRANAEGTRAFEQDVKSSFRNRPPFKPPASGPGRTDGTTERSQSKPEALEDERRATLNDQRQWQQGISSKPDYAE